MTSAFGAKTPKAIFLAALELASSERAAFVRAACGEDRELRQRVRALLAVHEEAEELLRDHDPSPAGFDDGLVAGVRVGPFRLREELGEGGFGTVWLAEQEEPVRRPVALKVLKAGLDTREVVSRFEAERQALALMDHPSIAKVFEGGTTDRGRPYFAMELVLGAPITEYCDELGLDLRARLELFLEVCRAVQHAHQKGIVHRDLKPNNVLVTEVDGRAVPKVIDFGIAKALEGELAPRTFATRGGQLIGTPTYMSPEQAGGSLDVDTRADVYALGVLLYELLAGSPPFGEHELLAAGLGEIQRVIREVDPPKPSTRLGRTTRRGDSGVSWRSVRGDLDWIVMRCLEKDRERRYDSAAVLANDVVRHLSGDPVLAGPPDLLYRTRKFLARHRAGLAVCALLLTTLVSGALFAQVQARRAFAAETEARRSLGRSEAIAGFLERVLLSVDPAVARGRDTELLREVLAGAAADLDADRGPPELEATLRRILGSAYLSIARLADALPQFERALELRESLSGDAPLELALALDDYGATLVQLGRASDGLPHLERATEQGKRLLDPEDERLQNVLGNLALAYRYTNDQERALELFRELEALQRTTLGDVHEETALTINNLASVLNDMGRAVEAHAYLETALEIQLELGGEQHPRTAMALNNLGLSHLDAGRLEEAEELIERSLELKHEVFDAGHPSILVSYNNLAMVYERQGDLERTRAMQETALEHAREHVGPEHANTLTLTYNHASFLLKLGDYAGAEPLLVDAHARIEPLETVSPKLRVLCESALAEAQLETGRPEEARGHAQAALDAALEAELFPAGAEALGVMRSRLGRIHLALGDEEAARAELDRALRDLEATEEAIYSERARAALRTLGDR